MFPTDLLGGMNGIVSGGGAGPGLNFNPVFGSNPALGGFPDLLSGPGAGALGLGGMLSGGNTPQQKGYGIQPPGPRPYDYTVAGPQDQSMMRGMAGPSGLDFMAPGALEAYQQQTQGFFNNPTMSQQYLNRAAQDPRNQASGTNRAEEWYQQFKGFSPSGMDPYYSRARERTQSDLDKAMASRGMLGSGASAQASVDAMSALGAEQANREADYQLQRQGLGGNLARAADLSSAQRSADQLGWLTGLGGLAGQADAANLSQIMGGGNLAGAAQGAQRARGRDFMSDIMGGAGMTMPVLQGGYQNILGTDMGLMDQSMQYGSGLAREALNQSYRNQDRQKQDANWAADMFGSVMGGFMGM